MTIDEWDQRELCPDGSCTGVIGADGLCKVCGRAAPNWGEERKRGMIADAEVDAATAAAEDEADAGADAGDVPAAAPAPEDDTEAYEWSRRRLCPDEACVGLLGPDGKCKVCGRSAA